MLESTKVFKGDDMSGPQRVAWTFPKNAATLIEALEVRQKDLVVKIDQALDGEQEWVKTVQEYREKLRQAGVDNWEHAFPENTRDLHGKYRSNQHQYVRELDELMLYLSALRADKKLNPHRLYKLSPDDLKWFGLDGSL